MRAVSPAKRFGRRAFGGDPAGYHRSRPPYPDWVYDTLTTRCGLRPGAAVFEIGAGTGIATRRLLDLGANPLVAIEPDQRLADFMRAENSDEALNVAVSTFETTELEPASFDLGICATAFHWLHEGSALTKIARLLRPGGWWVAAWNVFGADSRPDPFYEATKNLLEAPDIRSAGKRGFPFALDSAARLAALKRNGSFDEIDSMASQWSLTLNADQMMALYGTYSNVIGRADREELLAEIGRIAREDFGDRVVRNMTTTLYVGRRKESA